MARVQQEMKTPSQHTIDTEVLLTCCSVLSPRTRKKTQAGGTEGRKIRRNTKKKGSKEARENKEGKKERRKQGKTRREGRNEQKRQAGRMKGREGKEGRINEGRK